MLSLFFFTSLKFWTLLKSETITTAMEHDVPMVRDNRGMPKYTKDPFIKIVESLTTWAFKIYTVCLGWRCIFFIRIIFKK